MKVYMPYQCTDNYDCYVEYLGKISVILEECTTTKIAIVGDFNAADSTSFEAELLTLCESQNLVISDYQLLGRFSEQFTFVSDAHSTTSWLEHYICSHDLHQRITTLHILDKSPYSDYLPIHAVFILMLLEPLTHVKALRVKIIQPSLLLTISGAKQQMLTLTIIFGALT